MFNSQLFSNCELSREPSSPLEIGTSQSYAPVSVLCQRGSDQHVAFCMARHSRLGADSPANVLPPELVHHILTFVGISGFIVTGGMSEYSGCEGVRFCPTILKDNGDLDVLGCFEFPQMPCPRSGHASLTLHDQLYVIGGYSHPYSLQSCSMLSLRTNKWASIADMTISRHGGFAAQVLSDTIIVAGGRNLASRGQVTSQAEQYHPQAGKWIPLPAMSTSRYGCASGEVSGVVIVAGGSSEKGNTNTCEFLDPRAGQWQKLPCLPQALSGACAAVGGNYSLVVCGGALGLKNFSRDVLTLDIRKPVWQCRPNTLHHPRVCASALSIGNSQHRSVLVLGGKNNYEGTECINCETMEVSLLPWRVPLWHHSCSTATI